MELAGLTATWTLPLSGSGFPHAGVVSSVQVGSRNSLADVLRTLGDLSRTATDHMYASMLGGVKRMARDVTQAVIAGAAVNYMSSPSLLMGGS